MLRPWLLPIIAFLTAPSGEPEVRFNYAADFQIITVRAIESAKLGEAKLVVVDGGYAEGLELGQTGAIGQPIGTKPIPGWVEVFDIDCHQAYCIARPRPEVEPLEFLRALDAAKIILFEPPDSSTDHLRQRAIRAMSEGDYRCAVARLTRLIQTDPENSSLQSALDRARGKLNAEREVPLDSAAIAFEQAKLPLYSVILTWYFRQNRYERVKETADRILAIDPTNAMAANYRSVAAAHLGGSASLAAHKTRTEILDFPPLHGPDSASIVVNPEFVYRRAPLYPPDLRTSGVTGRVWMKVHIDKDGNVIQSEVLHSSGDTRLDDSARAASWFCKFKPSVRDGRMTDVWAVYPVDFGLDKH